MYHLNTLTVSTSSKKTESSRFLYPTVPFENEYQIANKYFVFPVRARLFIKSNTFKTAVFMLSKYINVWSITNIRYMLDSEKRETGEDSVYLLVH